MPARLRYGQLAPEGVAHMTALEHYLNTASGLDPVLLDLVRLRASLLNGCEYCIRLHTAELQKLSQSAERIAGVADWRSPWLAEGDWWNRQTWALEQWDLIGRSSDGAMLCCCPVRDLKEQSWQVVTLYD